MAAPKDNAGSGDETSEHAPVRRRLALGRAPRTRSVLLATGILVVGVSSFAVAATGNSLREGKRNGTTRAETEIIGNLKSVAGKKGGYVTRQSNLSSSGGGAIYGCRSQEGGSGAKNPQNPCIRANNLSKGLAFEFNSQNGNIVGAITAGTAGDASKPFVTNATGVATGLNADRVDGADLAQILKATSDDAQNKAVAAGTAAATIAKSRWFLLDESGKIIEQSGGFTNVEDSGYNTNGNVYIDAGDDLSDNGLGATIALQNQVDVDGTAGADPNFGGEVSVSRCQIPDVVDCQPADAKNTNSLVVSPRDSAGAATTATNRERVYVTVTGQAPAS